MTILWVAKKPPKLYGSIIKMIMVVSLSILIFYWSGMFWLILETQRVIGTFPLRNMFEISRSMCSTIAILVSLYIYIYIYSYNFIVYIYQYILIEREERTALIYINWLREGEREDSIISSFLNSQCKWKEINCFVRVLLS